MPIDTGGLRHIVNTRRTKVLKFDGWLKGSRQKDQRVRNSIRKADSSRENGFCTKMTRWRATPVAQHVKQACGGGVRSPTSR
mmetsp:Transcript_154488/g.284648  ORF Transcript_154488/g.284648 Transcript_154488/m.284648 type:complete len:82 (-) Transcript_154488:766-1011(-)